MTRNNIFTVMMMVITMMTSVNTFAQGRGGNNQMMGNRGGNREMTMNRSGEMSMNRGGAVSCGMNDRGGMRHEMSERHGVPCVDARGFVPGWEGRVMYRDGRWGYLRGADWYWYDTYYEPDFYFGRPVGYFGAHCIPVDGRVAAGVAIGATVGALISALCH